ncbi:MAG: hypothetical protein ACKOXK_07690 [Chakrabartia sp.]
MNTTPLAPRFRIVAAGFAAGLLLSGSLAIAATTNKTTATTTVQSSSTILGVGTKKPGPGNPKKGCPGTAWQAVTIGNTTYCVKQFPTSP